MGQPTLWKGDVKVGWVDAIDLYADDTDLRIGSMVVTEVGRDNAELSFAEIKRLEFFAAPRSDHER
jgi:hypothetical protein